jgi:hypothetical protein
MINRNNLSAQLQGIAQKMQAVAKYICSVAMKDMTNLYSLTWKAVIAKGKKPSPK